MNHWLFVGAAYGVTLLGICGLLIWAHWRMRRSEAAGEAVKALRK